MDVSDDAASAAAVQPGDHDLGGFAGVPVALGPACDHPRHLGGDVIAVPGDGRLHEADRTGVAAATDDPVARALLPVGGAASGLVAVGLPQLFESCRLAAGERLQFGVVEQRGHLLGVADRQRLQPQPGGFECHSSRPVIQAPLRAA